MKERTDQDFIEWLSGATLYVGYARYAQFGKHGFVCATCYCEDPRLAEAVHGLDAGDEDALDAAEYVKNARPVWFTCDPNPATALADLVEKLRRYYFDKLNGGSH